MEVSHIVVKKGGIFLERGLNSESIAYRCLKGGGGGVHSGREVEILRASLCIKGGIFWEGGIDSGSVHIVAEKRGIFLEGGVDSGSVTLYKRGYIQGGRGIFWVGRIYMFKNGCIVGG